LLFIFPRYTRRTKKEKIKNIKLEVDEATRVSG
jgi:hypothetical protein